YLVISMVINKVIFFQPGLNKLIYRGAVFTMPVKSIQINLFNNDEVRAPMGIISKPIIVSQFVEPQTEPHIRAAKHDGIRVGCLLQKSDGGRKASPIAIQLDLPDNATDLKQ